MAVNNTIAFFPSFSLPFFIYHLKTFLPPLSTVQFPQLHPWLDRECAAAKKKKHTHTTHTHTLGSNLSNPGMSSSPYTCLSLYLCEITSCIFWLWECGFCLYDFIITVSLLPLLPPAMFSGCISPCIRPDLNINHELSPPPPAIDSECTRLCLDQHIPPVTCISVAFHRERYVFSCYYESPLLPFVKIFDNILREWVVGSVFFIRYEMCSLNRIRSGIVFVCGCECVLSLSGVFFLWECGRIRHNRPRASIQ